MKKVIWLLGVFFIGVHALSAQESAPGENAPKISASKLKWSKRIQVPRFVAGDPMAAQRDVNAPIFEPNPAVRLKEYFVYEAVFKNETGRGIKGILWDYVFLDAGGAKELQRHEILHPYKIGKNKSVESRIESAAPPTNAVSYADLEKNKRSPYVERAEIKCVVFDDDSTWVKAGVGEGVCEKLRERIRRRERRDR